VCRFSITRGRSRGMNVLESAELRPTHKDLFEPGLRPFPVYVKGGNRRGCEFLARCSRPASCKQLFANKGVAVTRLPDLAARKSATVRLGGIVADITTLRVDAIVNAAKHVDVGGGRRRWAFTRAAGPALLAECRTLGWLRHGRCQVTKGYHLPARNVIHAVGPVWQGGDLERRRSARLLLRPPPSGSDEETASASIAFTPISTGVYNFPADSRGRHRRSRRRVGAAASALALRRVILAASRTQRRRPALKQRLHGLRPCVPIERRLNSTQ